MSRLSAFTARLRAVFDCNTLVQAIAFDDGPAAKCVALVESGKIELFVSKPTLAELRRVLAYEEVLASNRPANPIAQRLMARISLP